MYDHHNTITTHFVQRLAYHPRASNRKDRMNATPAEDAVKLRYITPDRPTEITWLKFDLDGTILNDKGKKVPREVHTAVHWLDNDAPRPHFIVRNRNDMGCHYLYGLRTPVLRGSLSRTGPRKLFEAVNQGMTLMLDADPGYVGTGVKNPLHPHWDTITSDLPLYDLNDFMEHLPRNLRRQPERGELVGEGRNTDLFYHLRLWAYDHVHEAWKAGRNADQWYAAVHREATSLNRYDKRLPYSEVRHIARSVSKWTWERAANFHPTDRTTVRKRSNIYSWNRRPLTAEQAREAMQEGGSEGGIIGAPITHAIRRSKTYDTLTAAIGTLAGQGHHNPSAELIAVTAGVSLSTVRRFRRDGRIGASKN